MKTEMLIVCVLGCVLAAGCGNSTRQNIGGNSGTDDMGMAQGSPDMPSGMSCHGTASTCDSMSLKTGCTGLMGCAWTEGSCSGQPQACNAIGGNIPCTEAPGCFWDDNVLLCTGKVMSCESRMSVDLCQRGQGCKWQPAACSGNPAACATFQDAASCQGQKGCFWGDAMACVMAMGTCNANADCCAGLSCLDNVCRALPKMGALGSSCTGNGACDSMHCSLPQGSTKGVCVETCTMSSACAADLGGPSACVPSKSLGHICLPGCKTSDDCKPIDPSFSCIYNLDIEGDAAGVCYPWHDLPDGTSCMDPSQCASGDCYKGFCMRMCTKTSDCTGSTACVLFNNGNACIPTCNATPNVCKLYPGTMCQLADSTSGAQNICF